MTSENSSATPLSSHKCLPKWLIWSLIMVSFLGFLDASYLTIAHFTGLSLRCTVLNGCDQVTTSPYSLILGIPVALLGMFYYLTILLATLFYFDSRQPGLTAAAQRLPKLIAYLTCLGFLASVWFVYLQFFVIKALCQYCMISALASTLLFIFGLIIFKIYGKK